MSMKRVLSVCLALLLLCICAVPATVSAASTPTLSLDKVQGEAGATVQVNLRISGNSGIVATRVHVQFDHTVLELMNVANGTIFPEEMSTFNPDYTSAVYTMLWIDSLNTTDYTADGVLATMTFRIREGAAVGASAITLTYDSGSTFNSNLTLVPFALESGSVTVIRTVKAVTGVSVPGSLTMTYKNPARLEATVYPADAANPAVMWRSDNEKVVTVDANGNLTAHRAGTATITVVTQDGGYSAECKVTVQYTFLQKIIIYLLFGFLWYLG